MGRMDAPPPLPDDVRDGDERTTLIDMLEFHRAVLVRKAWGLSPAQLNESTGSSTLTMGGLLKHMAWVEQHWFYRIFLGNEQREPWLSAPWDSDTDWELTSAAGASLDELLELYDREVATAREIVAASPDLDALAPPGSRGRINLRWILVHMIEEYARHCGHADLIRESIDGTVGD
jgi:uncharacterized damage-inducible protein DinB